jgi:hypothetical protein
LFNDDNVMEEKDLMKVFKKTKVGSKMCRESKIC